MAFGRCAPWNGVSQRSSSTGTTSSWKTSLRPVVVARPQVEPAASWRRRCPRPRRFDRVDAEMSASATIHWSAPDASLRPAGKGCSGARRVVRPRRRRSPFVSRYSRRGVLGVKVTGRESAAVEEEHRRGGRCLTARRIDPDPGGPPHRSRGPRSGAGPRRKRRARVGLEQRPHLAPLGRRGRSTRSAEARGGPR